MNNVFELLLLGCEDNQDRILFTDEKGSLTYKNAKNIILSIATYLKNKNISNQPILVPVTRSKDVLLMFLGIALSNNYYVPISDDTKIERLNDIIEIGNIKFSFDFENPKLESLSFNDACNQLFEDSDYEVMKEKFDKNNPLYLMFTSGSTGKPKGVLKSHDNVLAFVENFKETFKDIEENQNIANQTPFYFDASSKDIYLTLGLKGTLYIPNKEVFVLPNKSVEYLNEKKISMIMWVPSALIMIAKIRVLSFIKPKYLKYVFFIGEVFPSKYLNMWYKAMENTKFINWYGSTETAGACLYYPLTRELNDSEIAPIGKPLANNLVKLEDGEICISSRQVALCYVNDEEKTKKTFVKEGERIYLHTGDFAQYDEEGNVIFKTRKDFQIKHLGYRIELQDIEASVMSINYITSCCCLYVKEKIILVVVLSEEKKVSDIFADLKVILADYMMPNKIVIKEVLPLNANGKIDRVLLKQEMEK